MTTLTNKILASVIIIAVVLSVVVLVYINLPKQSETENITPPPTRSPILTVTVNGHQTNYTLGELQTMEAYTAKGGYRTSFPSIKGLGNYTGVRIQTLVNTIGNIPNNYSVHVISSDGSNKTFNHSIVLGNVDRYTSENASDAKPIGNGGLTMVLAYQYEGNYLNVSKDGNLKIVFLDNQGSITSSGLWWKYITAIEIVPE